MNSNPAFCLSFLVAAKHGKNSLLLNDQQADNLGIKR